VTSSSGEVYTISQCRMRSGQLRSTNRWVWNLIW